MKEHDWMKLYADAEKFMKKVGGTDFNIKTNRKMGRGTCDGRHPKKKQSYCNNEDGCE